MHRKRTSQSTALKTALLVGISVFLWTMDYACPPSFWRGPSAALAAEPTAEELRGTIQTYIQNQVEKLGAFAIPDPAQIGKLRTLELVRVHERVGKTGDYYYSCTDMRDVATGDLLDLDFDISDSGEALKVVAVRIHKDNGNPRYTYDDNDNLIPLR